MVHDRTEVWQFRPFNFQVDSGPCSRTDLTDLTLNFPVAAWSHKYTNIVRLDHGRTKRSTNCSLSRKENIRSKGQRNKLNRSLL